MKKAGTITFLLFFALLNSSFSQGFERNKWQVGVFLTPKIDYRIIQAEGEDERSLLYIQGKNESDKVRYGLDVGLACFYNISDKTRLKLGFEITQTGYYYGAFHVSEPDTSSNNLNYTITYFNRTLLFKHTLFKIPIGLRYTLYNEKRRSWPFVEADIKPSFHSSFFKNPDIYWSTALTLGYTFSMVHVDQLYLGLTLDYFLTEFPESNSNIHPYSIGLEIGFIFW